MIMTTQPKWEKLVDRWEERRATLLIQEREDARHKLHVDASYIDGKADGIYECIEELKEAFGDPTSDEAA